MSNYIVTKPIPVNEGVIEVGTIVDASGWRNLRSLISSRYLAPAPADATADGAGTRPKASKSKPAPAEPVGGED